MASNAKNLAELLNTDSTVAVADVADGSITTAKLAADAVGRPGEIKSWGRETLT